MAEDNIGALNLTGLDKENIDPEYYRELGKLISPAYERPTGAEVAFNFFSGMSEAASQAGSTFVGSVGGGARKAGEYLLKDNLAAKERERNLGLTGLKLASAMKGKGQYKSVNAPDRGIYRTLEDAEQYFKALGGVIGSDGWKDFVATAVDKEKAGQPYIVNSSYSVASPVYRDGELVKINFSPSVGAAKTPAAINMVNNLNRIGKHKTEVMPLINTSIPVAEVILNKLLVGEQTTGALTPFRTLFASYGADLFGLEDDDLNDAQFFESVVNKIGPSMRPIGSGSTSDVEFKAYKDAFGGLQRTPRANYMSIYSYIKMARNNADLIQKEEELLTSGKFEDATKRNAELADYDKGIFAKFTLPEGIDPNDAEAVDRAEKEWFLNVPQGEVIFNVDSNGEELFTFPKEVNKKKNKVGTYYIKGFGLGRDQYQKKMFEQRTAWGLR
tara:strand:+ start:37 stop:1365 length:1329 start_codon:yes stop_codon:yes gene_type:complete